MTSLLMVLILLVFTTHTYKVTILTILLIQALITMLFSFNSLFVVTASALNIEKLSSYCVIVWVRVVLKRTGLGD